MRRLSDNEHMHRLAAGQVEHLAPLYSRWRSKVMALCYGMTGNGTDAADLVHDVFLRVVRYRQTFRGDAAFGSWLYTMARRVCLDHLDRDKQHRRALGELQPVVQEVRPARDEDRIARLRRAFESLRSEQREILVLHRVHGLKYREIAELWDSNEGAVKVRAHRALNELREHFRRLERDKP